MNKITTKKLLPCPVAVLLQIVGTRWKILIVKELLTGTKRFSELKKAVVCSQKVLTSNLRELEADSIISRKVYAQIPPKVEYSLTNTGKTLEPIVKDMAKWGEYYQKLCTENSDYLEFSLLSHISCNNQKYSAKN